MKSFLLPSAPAELRFSLCKVVPYFPWCATVCCPAAWARGWPEGYRSIAPLLLPTFAVSKETLLSSSDF